MQNCKCRKAYCNLQHQPVVLFPLYSEWAVVSLVVELQCKICTTPMYLATLLCTFTLQSAPKGLAVNEGQVHSCGFNPEKDKATEGKQRRGHMPREQACGHSQSGDRTVHTPLSLLAGRGLFCAEMLQLHVVKPA